MRLTISTGSGQRDLLLLIGFGLAAVVIFSRPITAILDVARDVERTYGLALLPGLIVLTVVFFFHLQTKRHEMREQAADAAASMRQAEDRARDLERLVSFGQALTRSLDLEAIRDALLQHMHALADASDSWVLIRGGGTWQQLYGKTPEARLESAREQLADQALALDSDGTLHPAVSWDGHVCFPMVAGGTAVGVLGLPEGAVIMTDGRRRVLSAAATMLAVSVKNAQLFREVRENSLRDGLTGCFNKTHALEVIDTELRRARRSQLPLSVVMFDIDHFKEVNDRYGHLCGDAVLAMVGRRLKDVLRGSDMKCRYGGEEFLVLLPETPLEGAKRVAETLRRELSEAPVRWNSDVVNVTASFGVAVALPSEVDTKALIGRADAALYRAKEEGRNCVRIAGVAVPTPV